MRLMFICGSMEPGRDGVGDYVRRLAGELARRGHGVRTIALCDRQATRALVESQDADGTPVEVLRLPRRLPAHERFASAGGYVSSFAPDWISLQYVPHAFHPRGLPLRLPARLARLAPGANRHVMFHELWVGALRAETFTGRFYRPVQRWLAARLMRKFRPAAVSTQSDYYRDLLAALGAGAAVLPLFGNIPVAGAPAPVPDNNRVRIVVFGTIHPRRPIDRFAGQLALGQKAGGFTATVDFAGANGPGLDGWKASLDGHGIRYRVHGFCTGEQISELMASADAGLTTTGPVLAQKSGTVVSLMEHGVRVISIPGQGCAERNATRRNPLGITVYTGGAVSLELLRAPVRPAPVKDGLARTAAQMEDMLAAAGKEKNRTK